MTHRNSLCKHPPLVSALPLWRTILAIYWPRGQKRSKNIFLRVILNWSNFQTVKKLKVTLIVFDTVFPLAIIGLHQTVCLEGGAYWRIYGDVEECLGCCSIFPYCCKNDDFTRRLQLGKRHCAIVGTVNTVHEKNILLTGQTGKRFKIDNIMKNF